MVLNKSNGDEYISSIDNAGCESGFNSCGLEFLKDLPELQDVEIPPPPPGFEHIDYFRDVKKSIEEKTAEFDSISASLINLIVAKESFSSLTNDDKYDLAIFVALQMERGPVARSLIKDLNQGLFKKAREIAGREDVIVNGRDKEMCEDELKHLAMMILPRALNMVPILLSKMWILFKTPPNSYLYISDNPVTRYNRNDFGPYGNLGLLSKGVELNIPISSTLSIGIYCKSYWDELVEAQENAMAIFDKDPIANILNPRLGAEVGRMLFAVKSGSPLNMDERAVEHLNYLQILQSHRYLYSSKLDYAFARKVLLDSPDIRQRYRMRFD